MDKCALRWDAQRIWKKVNTGSALKERTADATNRGRVPEESSGNRGPCRGRKGGVIDAGDKGVGGWKRGSGNHGARKRSGEKE